MIDMRCRDNQSDLIICLGSGPDIAKMRPLPQMENWTVAVAAEQLVAGLSVEYREALQKYGARASWPSGFILYQRGTNASGVFVVLSGRIVLRSRVRAGRGFVPEIVSPGEAFGAEGLAPNGRYATDARADEASETLHISGERFRQFVREQPPHALRLIGQIMSERQILLEKLRELTTLSVEQRLVATLLRLAESQAFTADDGRMVLPSSRYRLLCELVGATRESVSLVLGRLAAEGLIERDGGAIVVSRSSRLAERLESEWSGETAFLETAIEPTARLLH